jgi:hypothetical protein
LIAAEQGVFFASEEKVIFTNSPCFQISPKIDDPEEYNANFYLGLSVYLKSNFALWYSLMHYETDDIFRLFFPKKPAILIPDSLSIIKNLSSFGKNILTEEKNFLKKFNKLEAAKNDREIGELVENHNKAAESQLRLAEREIITYFGLNKQDTLHIYNSLDDLGYYTYNIVECIDEIVN